MHEIALEGKTYYHTFQPPSSSKREVCNKPSIIRRLPKIWILGFLKACKMHSPGSFAVPNYHYRKLNFAYPPDITIRNSIMMYLTPQQFSWFKNYKLLVFKLLPGIFFASAKTITALVDTDLLVMMKMVAKSNART